MLDFDRDHQRRGPFPNVRLSLIVFWAVEAERQQGCSWREAVRRITSRPPVRSRGSVERRHREGRKYDAELQAVWGTAYPVLKAETMVAEKL